QVEREKGTGYRTVRTTTDKFGRWCKPHKLRYRDFCIVVIRNWDTDRQHVWRSVGKGGVYVDYANGDGFTVVEAPFWCKPRRTDEPYTIEMRPILGEPGAGEKFECVHKADLVVSDRPSREYLPNATPGYRHA